MATVQVDLSEYDMLREAKDKAEKRVEELKETIKGLENKSRVILTTQYVYPEVNYDRIYSDIEQLIEGVKNRSNLRDSPRYSMQADLSIHNGIEYTLRSNIKFDNMPYDISLGKYSSSQYIGFEDVKAKVEAHYKKDIDKAIADYKESEETYNRLKNSVEKDVKEMYSNTINKLKKSIKDITESKDTEIKALKDKITELSKSKEEKIAELTKTIEEAQAKLYELSEPKKKGLFTKIFK